MNRILDLELGNSDAGVADLGIVEVDSESFDETEGHRWWELFNLRSCHVSNLYRLTLLDLPDPVESHKGIRKMKENFSTRYTHEIYSKHACL